MPPGQVSRGQGGTGLRFLTRFLSLWRKRDKGTNKNHNSDNGGDSHSQSKGKVNPNNGNNGNKSDGSVNSSSNSSIGGTSSTSSASLSEPGKFSPSPGPPSFPPCFLPLCVPDNDPRVVYSTSWTLSPHGFYRTSHQTDIVGSSLSFKFNGTGIIVFGSIPPSNATHAPPTAAYSIDAAAPVITAEPLATDLVLNQQLFAASGLTNGPHTLAINVTDVQSASPFVIDYFIVRPTAPLVPPVPSASAISPEMAINHASVKTSPGATVRILAGVLGSVIFVLLCAVALFIVIWRRRRRRALRTKDLQSSLFTTPESIVIYSREPSSHYRETSNPWLSKTRSIGGKSWVTTNFEISEKSRSTVTS